MTRQWLVHKAMDAIVLDLEAPPGALSRGNRAGSRRRTALPQAPAINRQQAIAAVEDRMPTDVGRPPVSPIDPAEIQRAARLRIQPNALTAHPLQRVVGKLVDPSHRAPRPELRQCLLERLDGPIEMPLLLRQLKILAAHQPGL